MPNFWEKADQAASTGAHVAAVLYKALEAEELRGGDYNDGHAWKSAVQDLLRYRGNLKKAEDRTAVEEFCALRHGPALNRSGFGVDITARITEPSELEIS